MKLSASARENKRYILIGAGDKEDIEKMILDYIGILGWAKAKPIFIEKEGKLILSVNRKELNNVRAAFEICKEKISIIGISGTLKGLERFYRKLPFL